MIKIKNNILFLIFLMILSCNKNQKNYNHIDFLKEESLNGNIDAYNQFIKMATEPDSDIENLRISMIMANTYKYPQAYYDVYFTLYSNFNHKGDYSLDSIDSLSKSIILKYMKEGINLGNMRLSKIFIEYYDYNKSYPIKELYSDEQFMEKIKANLK